MCIRDREGDTLAGFRAGADDYITKPFSFPVLVAKAQALMRRARGLRLGASELGYANILMDTASGTVTVDGNPVNLRPKDCLLYTSLRFSFRKWSAASLHPSHSRTLFLAAFRLCGAPRYRAHRRRTRR